MLMHVDAKGSSAVSLHEQQQADCNPQQRIGYEWRVWVEIGLARGHVKLGEKRVEKQGRECGE